jgi:hypothetical protein
LSEPKNQHIIPKVYLKSFRFGNDNKVFCIDLNHPYKKDVQIVGTNDNRFKIENFYTDSTLEDIYAIERYFSAYIENPWPYVLEEITNKKPLSQKTKETLINWLYASSFRNKAARDNYEDIVSWSQKIIAGYRKEQIDEVELEQYSKKLSKEMQLGAFKNPEAFEKLFPLFFNTLTNKLWKILITPPGYYFLTNDKPCYSPNMNPRFRTDKPFHYNPELNSQSQIYFVMSPEYCLEIVPFVVGTPLYENLWNTTPEYEVITPLGVGIINKGIIMTADRFLISNNKELLEHFLKKH